MKVTMELVGTIGGDGFLNEKWFYQCPECKMLEIYSHSTDIPDPNECERCKDEEKLINKIHKLKKDYIEEFESIKRRTDPSDNEKGQMSATRRFIKDLDKLLEGN